MRDNGSFKARVEQLLGWSERFADLSWRGDIFGGVTTAIISLPLALAFGVASGAGAGAGLAGAVLVGLFAALFGGTRTLISEPTGPMTVVMTAVITTLIAQNPEHGLAMAFSVVLVAGATQVAFGAFRLGRYITLMPYSVISGFMSGIGILLILLQIYPLFGADTPTGGALAALKGLPGLFSGIELPEVIIALTGMVILFGMPQAWRRVCPPHLVALVAGTLVAIFVFDPSDLDRIGTIPMGLPEFRLPYFTSAQLSMILIEGMILGILGCVDTLLTAMIADSLTRKHHNSDRELIGQGIANMVSSLFGGLPGAGATMGTVANIQVGARSPLAAIIRSLLLLGIIFFLAPLLVDIPLAILAAIAVKVGMDILDWSFLKRAHALSMTAACIMYGVMALTVLVDLVVAVGVGVFIANILTIEKLTRHQSRRLGTIDVTDDEIPLSPEERALFERGEGKILLFHLSGPMIFGVAKAIAQEQEAIREAKVLIMDLSDVPLLSTTVALALENMIQQARSLNIPVLLSAQPGDTLTRMKRIEATGTFKLTFCQSRKDALTEALTVLSVD